MIFTKLDRSFHIFFETLTLAGISIKKRADNATFPKPDGCRTEELKAVSSHEPKECMVGFLVIYLPEHILF